jgi:putative endonuclease
VLGPGTMAFEKLAKSIQNRTQFGQEIEHKAAAWLDAEPGWRKLGQNFRTKAGELDLIYEHRRRVETPQGLRVRLELVFVEVRARAPDGIVTGFESVGEGKRQKLVLAARAYLSRYRGRAVAVRFDVVDWNGRRFERLENAFFMG